MATITALLFNELGGSDKIYTGSVPKPKITKDTEILVKVKAAAINPADFLFSAGHYAIQPSKFPSQIGFEASGIIEETGKSTGQYVKGQHIHFIHLGCWAEYVILDTSTEFPGLIPDGISFEEGAQLSVNPVTAYGMLSELDIKEGEFLVQNVASSAVGKIVIQLAKARGIKTINIVRRDEHIAALKSLGGDFVINSEKEDVVKRIREIIPGGAKYALDALAGKPGAELLNGLAPGGSSLVYGLLSGEPHLTLGASVIFQSIAVKGFNVENWIKSNLAQFKQTSDFLANAVLTKKILLPYKSFDAKTQSAAALKHALAPGKTEKTILLF